MGTWWSLSEKDAARRRECLAMAREAKKRKAIERVKAKEIEDKRREEEAMYPWGKPSLLERLRGEKKPIRFLIPRRENEKK